VNCSSCVVTYFIESGYELMSLAGAPVRYSSDSCEKAQMEQDITIEVLRKARRLYEQHFPDLCGKVARSYPGMKHHVSRAQINVRFPL